MKYKIRCLETEGNNSYSLPAYSVVNITDEGKGKGKPIPLQALDRPCGFQEVEAPRFQDNQHMKVVKLSALRTGRLYPQEIFLVLISVRG